MDEAATLALLAGMVIGGQVIYGLRGVIRDALDGDDPGDTEPQR